MVNNRESFGYPPAFPHPVIERDLTCNLPPFLQVRFVSGPLPSANENNSVIWPELWSAFSNHREKIRELLGSVTRKPQGSLCVWGAGRTTDLDLIDLLHDYQKIDLVDLNASLTRQALVQRGFTEHPQVNVLPAMDLSGLNEHWDRIAPLPAAEKLREITRICSAFRLDLGRYDVVASTCLLSQILRLSGGYLNLATASQADTPALFAAIKKIREKHLELMLDHTGPGGTALLITDLTSREALPEILDPAADLNQLVKTRVMEGNHFHGLNPKSIVDFSGNPKIARKLRDVNVSSPWVWDSIEMQYLCLAFRFRKR